MGLTRSAKEAVRHLLYVCHADVFLQMLRNARKADTGHLRLNSLSDRFAYIYQNGVWVLDADTPGSGSGSKLSATEELRKGLPVLLDELNASSILDIGCGDFTWMNSVELTQVYIGADIVRSVVDANTRVFPKHRFICLDATKDPLPEVDVVMCREVLFHLSFEDGLGLLGNIRRSGAKYLLITSEETTSFNSNIRSGDYRPLNLRKPPFRFPPPSSIIRDGSVIEQRFMGLWRIDELHL